MMSEKRATLKSLIESNGGVHLSIYLNLNDNQAHPQAQLAKSLKIAANNLNPIMTRQERIKFLSPIHMMLKDFKVLETIKGNVGIFRTSKSLRAIQIPVKVKSSCSVATSFHVKPLLKWIQYDRDFLLVGIEKGAAHLYLGSQHSIRHIDSIIFSDAKLGISLPTKTNKLTIKGFEASTWLEECLVAFNKHPKPKLYIAGPNNLAENIRHGLSYRNIAKYPNWGSFKTKKLASVCNDIRSMMSHDIERYLNQSITEFEYANNMDLTETNIFKISKSAFQGKVKKLMISEDTNIFGKINTTTGEVVLHGTDQNHEDDCVLDDIAQKVLLNGGKVIVVPRSRLPGGYHIIAMATAIDPTLPQLQPQKTLSSVA